MSDRDQRFFQWQPCVIKAVKEIMLTYRWSYKLRDDLISEGNLILWKKLDKYDSSKGVNQQTHYISIIKFGLKDYLFSNGYLKKSQRQKFNFVCGTDYSYANVFSQETTYNNFLVDMEIDQDYIDKLAGSNYNKHIGDSILKGTYKIRPTKDELEQLLQKYHRKKVARMYNVNERTVCDWLNK